MQSRHIAVVLTIAACGGGGGVAHRTLARGAEPPRVLVAEVAKREGGPDVPYNRTLQKSSHNSYEREEPILDQLLYHRVRSLELDVHVARQGAAAPAGDWFVFHEDNPLMTDSSCDQLSDCLGLFDAFHVAVPRHEVLTLFLDLKSDFGPGHQPKDLDDALVHAFGRDALVTPGDLMTACPQATSLREAVTGNCAFPTLRALRGKIMVAVTGGSDCDAKSKVSRYGGGAPTERLAFLAPNVSASCTVADHRARPDVVFFNMTAAEKDRASEVRALGLVARVYGDATQGGLDDPPSWNAARAAGAVHLATDKINFERDPWSATHRAGGSPFFCESCSGDEPGAFVGVRAASGDQWGTADSGFYALERAAGDATWEALVSVPSSHVEPFAKACLVARASEDPAAANVAVCRPFDLHPARFQVRSAHGDVTTSVEADRLDGLTAETPAFLRLAIRGREAAGFVSADGIAWTQIGTTILSEDLPWRGVSASSKGPAVRALFTNLSRGSGAMGRVTATALRAKAIGSSARGDVFDGVFAPEP